MPSPQGHRCCVWLSRDRLYPRRAPRSAVGMPITLAGPAGGANTPPVQAVGAAAGWPGDDTHSDQAKPAVRRQSEISARTASRSRSITDGTEIAWIARSGSLSPWPVNTHTTLDPAGTPCFNRPATEAEEAASQNTDSSLAKNV